MRFWKQRDKDLEEELSAHLRMAAQERIERGATDEEARASARREFGNVQLVKETTRSIWGWTWLERFVQDIRFAARTLRKDLGFTIVAVLTLALGIGANTAIFSVFNGILLQPLVYRDPGQLYGIWITQPTQAGRMGISGLDLVDFHDQARSFDQVGAALSFSWVFVIGGEAKMVVPTAVSPDLFPMLGVRPILGRNFLPQEYHVDGGYAILSYDFWQREFGGDPNIIGRKVAENHSMTVVGVMPRLPDFFPQTDVWVPLIPDFEFMKWRGKASRRVAASARRASGSCSRLRSRNEIALLRRPELP